MCVVFVNDYVTTEISVGKTCHEDKIISGRFLDGFGLWTLFIFQVVHFRFFFKKLSRKKGLLVDGRTIWTHLDAILDVFLEFGGG
jgi:hypothetical protein